jgi:putative ABC transport system substrate-binding protein
VLNHKDLIIKLATQFRLPVVYSYRVFVARGGLMSYVTDITGQYKRAAGYVERILKGPKRTSDGAMVLSVLKVWRDRERGCP